MVQYAASGDILDHPRYHAVVRRGRLPEYKQPSEEEVRLLQ